MTVFTKNKYHFRFYASDRFEPPHVHVIQFENEAKIGLETLAIEYHTGYIEQQLERLVKMTAESQDQLLEAWNDHFRN